MSHTPINAAFIGVGAFIGRMHLPHTAQNPKYRVHTLCDLNADLLAERARQYRPLKTTADYREILADPEVDVVFIGTRGDQHARFICEIAAAGKNIVVEKPMTQTYQDTERVLKAVRENKVGLLVGYNRRFAPIMQKARSLYLNNRQGPANLFYRIVTEVKEHYAFDLKTGGGHLVTEGCHIFDFLPWFLEEEPVEIFAAGEEQTNDHVTIKFDKGSIATMILSVRGGLCYPKECLEVYSNWSTLVVDNYCEIRTDNVQGAERRSIFPVKWDEIPEVPGVIGRDGGIDLFFRKQGFQREHGLWWDRALQVEKGHYQLLDAYADALLAGKRSPVSEIDGARATICALKAMESLRANLPVKMPSRRRERIRSRSRSAGHKEICP